ncbi:MAG: VanZ family protein [Calditrichaeota bacterium]|nr:VanZ family protein [Calditrichota bacterium]
MRRLTPAQMGAIGWALLIFVLSSLPKIPTIPTGFRPIDKVAHFVEYFVFGLLLAGAFAHSSAHRLMRRSLVMAGILGVAYAVLDEFHQKFVPGRFATVEDAIADTLGVMVGLLVYLRWHRRQLRAQMVPEAALGAHGPSSSGSAGGSRAEER